MTVPATCDGCRRPIAPDEGALVLYRDGVPVATYHERCRPDRRRGGCGGAAC